MEGSTPDKIVPRIVPGANEEEENEALQQLLAGCLNQEESCQEKLYKKFYGYAFSIALKYCINRDEAVAIVNDGFMKVFKSIRQFHRASSFKPWLRRIIINTAIDHMRVHNKHRHHRELDDALHVEQPVRVLSDLHVEQILEWLEALPPLHRYVFNLYELDGYNHQEIAQMLNIPESSSRTYLTRAKAKLRKMYTTYNKE